MNKAVQKLNADLARYTKAQAAEKKAETAEAAAKTAEKKALAQITAQEKSLIDAFVAAPPTDPTQVQKLLGQLVSLGEKEQQTKDQFGQKIAADAKAVAADKKAVAADRKIALKDLKPAEYQLSLKATNQDRKELGLAPLKHALRNTTSYGEPWKKGPGQLTGGDTAHYQSQSTFESSIAGKQFAALKATEGTGYVDPTFRSRWNELGKKIAAGKMKLRVAYCFLDKGNGAAQAKHFLDTLGIHGKLQPGTRLALDWEASALSSPQTLKDAANYIHKVTGLWPIVYCSASRAGQAHATVPGAPMWVAQWTGGTSNHSVPFVQYSDGPGYDHDVFNGTLKALEKFAGWN